MYLREQLGLTYKDLAAVMGEYHDAHYTPDYWRLVLRERGAQPRHHGVRIERRRHSRA